MLDAPLTAPPGPAGRKAPDPLSPLATPTTIRPDAPSAGSAPRAKRHRVLLQGRIVAGAQLQPCVIRDLSRSGAKIRVAPRIALPDRFDLVIASDELRTVRACLRWRRGEFAGLVFEGV